MESESIIAILENVKQIGASLEKMNARIDILEDDFKERSVKRKMLRWLLTFYPFLMVILLFMVDVDHHKIAEVTGDIRELINDTRDLTSGTVVAFRADD